MLNDWQARDMQEEVRGLREDLADHEEMKQRLEYAQVCRLCVQPLATAVAIWAPFVCVCLCVLASFCCFLMCILDICVFADSRRRRN